MLSFFSYCRRSSSEISENKMMALMIKGGSSSSPFGQINRLIESLIFKELLKKFLASRDSIAKLTEDTYDLKASEIKYGLSLVQRYANDPVTYEMITVFCTADTNVFVLARADHFEYGKLVKDAENVHVIDDFVTHLSYTSEYTTGKDFPWYGIVLSIRSSDEITFHNDLFAHDTLRNRIRMMKDPLCCGGVGHQSQKHLAMLCGLAEIVDQKKIRIASNSNIGFIFDEFLSEEFWNKKASALLSGDWKRLKKYSLALLCVLGHSRRITRRLSKEKPIYCIKS